MFRSSLYFFLDQLYSFFEINSISLNQGGYALDFQSPLYFLNNHVLILPSEFLYEGIFLHIVSISIFCYNCSSDKVSKGVSFLGKVVFLDNIMIQIQNSVKYPYSHSNHIKFKKKQIKHS